MLEGQLQSGEFVVFLIALAGLAIVSLELKPTKKMTSFFFGYLALFTGTALSVLEGFVYFDQMNLAEHAIGFALAGLLFALCSYHAHKYLNRIEKKLGEKKWITS